MKRFKVEACALVARVRMLLAANPDWIEAETDADLKADLTARQYAALANHLDHRGEYSNLAWRFVDWWRGQVHEKRKQAVIEGSLSNSLAGILANLDADGNLATHGGAS